MHQLVLENALVVPGLSQNLTSHKQLVENGRMFFSHNSQSGIVLKKQPKLRSDNLSEFNSAEVKRIYRDKGIKRQFQVLDTIFKMEKQRNVWLMTKNTLLFSNVPRILWDEA
jgi:hypothetical protein